jgi:bis(5'-nucleosidyl)-tetraphosphatase
MRLEYSAGVVIYYKKKGTPQFLLLEYQRAGSSPSLFWDFPKGHLEGNETKQEAALRELKEETGLTAVIQPGFQEEFTYFFHDPKTKDLIKKTVYFFLAEALSNDVTLSDEHTNYAWLSYKKAFEQLTFENARDLLKKAYEVLKIKE